MEIKKISDDKDFKQENHIHNRITFINGKKINISIWDDEMSEPMITIILPNKTRLGITLKDDGTNEVIQISNEDK